MRSITNSNDHFSATRYDSNGTDDFRIDYPRTQSDTVIGIQVYNLNIVRNLDNMDLSWIEDRTPSKSRIRHFILCEDQLLKPANEQLEQIFSQIWEKRALNALIVYWNRTLNAVTFTPFPEMQLIFIANDELHNRDLLFMDRTKNLYGHSFKITAYYDESRARFNRNDTNDLKQLEGADGLLVRLIVEEMNATLFMSEPEDGLQIGELFPNKTATGCLAALMSGKYDMGLNIRFYRLNHFEGSVEATVVTKRDDICFLVPRKGQSADIANIFRPFRRYTWISLIVALPCYVVAFYLLVVRQRDVRSFQYHFFQFYAYMIQQHAPYRAKRRRQRILIGFWLISVLMLSFVYQSKLSGTLIIPKDQSDINNIMELANSNLKIMSFPRYNRQIIEFFGDSTYNGVFKSLFSKLINCTIDEMNESISTLNPAYGYANKRHINMHLRRVHTKGSSIFYHQIQQCPVPYLAVYGIRYGTPYKERINFIIRQAQEAGLMDKWESNDKMKEKKTQAKLHSGHGNIPFSLLHLQTAFYVYCLGCAIATTAFLFEYGFNRYKTGKLRVNSPF